jgi:hypothetical protein
VHAYLLVIFVVAGGVILVCIIYIYIYIYMCVCVLQSRPVFEDDEEGSDQPNRSSLNSDGSDYGYGDDFEQDMDASTAASNGRRSRRMSRVVGGAMPAAAFGNGGQMQLMFQQIQQLTDRLNSGDFQTSSSSSSSSQTASQAHHASNQVLLKEIKSMKHDLGRVTAHGSVVSGDVFTGQSVYDVDLDDCEEVLDLICGSYKEHPAYDLEALEEQEEGEFTSATAHPASLDADGYAQDMQTVRQLLSNHPSQLSRLMVRLGTKKQKVHPHVGCQTELSGEVVSQQHHSQATQKLLTLQDVTLEKDKEIWQLKALVKDLETAKEELLLELEATKTGKAEPGQQGRYWKDALLAKQQRTKLERMRKRNELNASIKSILEDLELTGTTTAAASSTTKFTGTEMDQAESSFGHGVVSEEDHMLLDVHIGDGTWAPTEEIKNPAIAALTLNQEISGRLMQCSAMRSSVYVCVCVFVSRCAFSCVLTHSKR